MKKVNKNRPALRENSPALLCIFSGQTAPNPRHYTRNAPITKIGMAFECHFFPGLLKWSPNVATLLWAKCGGEAQHSKVENLESSGTPECSELDSKAQKTLH